MTIDQLRGFLAFMVKNNAQDVQEALRSSGYTPASTGAGLVTQLMDIYSAKGTAELDRIFAKVSIDMNNTTQEDLAAIYELTSGQKVDTANTRFGWSDFQKLWAGSTVTTGSTSTSTSKPALSPTAVIITAIVAIIAIIIIWRMS